MIRTERTSARLRAPSVTRCTALVAIASAVMTVTSPCAADVSTSDAAAARVLFDQARRLMKSKHYAEACPKLEEGARLNPGIGMKFNLADCYEHIGRTASAWSLFLEAAAAAKTAHQASRESVARGRAKQLEKKLSRLRIEVPDEARAAGLEVMRSGEPIREPLWGTPVPVDPGAYLITATAPGHRPWQTRIDVAAAEKTTSIEIPALEALPPPPVYVAPAPPPPPEPSPLADRKTWGLVAVGVGVVGVGLGSYFGLRALSLRNDSGAHCNGNACDADGVSTRNDARAAGNASTLAYGVGALALAAGGVLLFLPRSHEPGAAAFEASPVFMARGGGVAMRGGW